MTNNEKFNQMLNACADPEGMLAALMALAPVIRQAKSRSDSPAAAAASVVATMQEGGEQA